MWEYSSGSVELKHRGHWGSLTREGCLGLRDLLEVNIPLQSPERTTFIVQSVLQGVKMMRWASMDLIKVHLLKFISSSPQVHLYLILSQGMKVPCENVYSRVCG